MAYAVDEMASEANTARAIDLDEQRVVLVGRRQGPPDDHPLEDRRHPPMQRARASKTHQGPGRLRKERIKILRYRSVCSRSSSSVTSSRSRRSARMLVHTLTPRTTAMTLSET